MAMPISTENSLPRPVIETGFLTMRTWGLFFFISLVHYLATASPVMAAETRYAAHAGKFEAIRIDSDEPETDSLLYVTCITPDMFEVLIGDELKFGSGEHEPVSATLSNGTLSTKVDGVSVKSPDYQMTGGAMLLTTLEPKGRAWRILTSGKPITIRPTSGDPETVSLGKAATDALKAFVGRCS